MSTMDPEAEPSGEGVDPILAGAGEPSAEGAPPPPEAPLPAIPVEEVALEPLEGVPGESGASEDLSLVLDVPVELTVEMGRATMTIRETLGIGTGSIITLNRLVGEPVDLFANGRLIARGEVIAIDEEYGLRVTEVFNSVANAA